MGDKIRQQNNVGDTFMVRVPIEIGSIIREQARAKGMSFSLFISHMVREAIEGNYNDGFENSGDKRNILQAS